MAQMNVKGEFAASDVQNKRCREGHFRFFYVIGPCSQAHADSGGNILTIPKTTRMSVKGVFVAGDVRNKWYR